MKGRRRDIHLHVMVTAEELARIRERMDEAGITNAETYVRKMALNAISLHVDLSPVKELVSLQRRCANNLNQVAVHANMYGVYPEEIAGLQRDYETLWGQVPMYSKLSELVAK
ncbi:MAG: plasmid mobilization protein [Clostridium fessum]